MTKNPKDGNSSTETKSFSELHVSIKTLGGAYGYNVATPPYDVKSTSINLTSWLQSLNDSRTHTMIDIQDGGLYPISDFILEENLSKDITTPTWIFSTKNNLKNRI